LASELVEPSSVTALPTVTLWLAPARATGGALPAATAMLTVAGVLEDLPSLTTRVAT
jgi:hypothetical protein